MGVRLLSALLALTLFGCAEGHCRRPGDKSAATQPTAPVAPADAKSMSEPSTKTSGEDHVFVYKYDGSLQCGQGKAVSVETMAKQLKGIPILSSSKKRDGLMHIQVCGSITGFANVYEIPAKKLNKAEAKGFKKWSFE